MPTTPTFQRLDLAQFEALLQRFPFSRKINAVHMHHTWRPRRADFRGHATIVGMWRYHTQTNGWSDIAQHITIAPDGGIWLGRNWNLPPASASGHNGNSVAGPFMFEMVGDFDTGQDPFDGAQREAVLRVVALVQRRFGLLPATLRFHNMMSTKSCPGSSINYAATVDAVTEAHQALAAAAGGGQRAPGERSPFPDEDGLFIQQAVRALTRITDNSGERGDVEHDHSEDEEHAYASAAGVGAASRGGSSLDAATLAALRPHLVNLRSGLFSTEGEFSSSPADVDAIFEQHLPRALEARAGGRRLQLLFFAHGGLVSETSALRSAHQHIGWWRKNGIYPIFFIWETGFFETIGQLLERAFGGARGGRDLADITSDPLIEIAARVLQGPRIWGGMKWAAERAAHSGGASAYVAEKLAAFCNAHAGRVDLHAVGHSAGSIFHAHFLPVTQAEGAPVFKTLHFLAPAIRMDTFKHKLLPGLTQGQIAAHLSVFTMQRDFERDDDCAGIYRKSLLYLIHHALENERRTPVLGLEDSLRADADIRRFFGLDGGTGRGEVIWSVTDEDSGRSASRSTTHGGFDEDAPTMNSIVRRVLDLKDADPIVDFPAGARAVPRPWTEEIDWPDDLRSLWNRPPPASPSAPWYAPPPWPQTSSPSPATSPGSPAASGGRRIALCMGVDAYPNPQHRLSGCVNDARTWASALSGLGFQVRLLLDGQATRAAMDAALRQLVRDSRAGDVIVVQYAGHGTHVNDLDGDETDGQDEALCPVDFAGGALYLDDDLAEAIAPLPDGVNLTFFMDCCHSGTNTRFAVGLGPGAASVPPGAKARFVVPTPELQAAHARFRGSRGATRPGGQALMRHIKFAACRDDEVALESGGNGEFTRRAAPLLARSRQGLTHEAFLKAVLSAFGSTPKQNPLLDCAQGSRGQALLQPLERSARAPDVADEAEGMDGCCGLVPTVQTLAETVLTLSKKLSP